MHVWLTSLAVVSGSEAVAGTAILCCFFFFQAEDGIRDLTVTGVQTCALPISLPAFLASRARTCSRRYRASSPYNPRRDEHQAVEGLDLPTPAHQADSTLVPHHSGAECVS